MQIFCFEQWEGWSQKFDPRSDERVFVGYSSSSKTYRVFNKRTQCIEESIYVVFDEDGNLKRCCIKWWRWVNWAV